MTSVAPAIFDQYESRLAAATLVGDFPNVNGYAAVYVRLVTSAAVEAHRVAMRQYNRPSVKLYQITDNRQPQATARHPFIRPHAPRQNRFTTFR